MGVYTRPTFSRHLSLPHFAHTTLFIPSSSFLPTFPHSLSRQRTKTSASPRSPFPTVRHPCPPAVRRLRCNVASPTTHDGTSSGNGKLNNFKTSSKSRIQPKQGPVISPEIARSALGSLIVYYKSLCREQPFIAVRLVVALFCVFASKLLGLAVPFLFKRAIDCLSQTAAPSSTATTAALKAATVAILFHGLARMVSSLTHELRNGIFSKAGQRMGRSITATAFAHLHSLDLTFHTASRTGALTRMVDRGTRSVMTIFRALVFSFMPTFFELMLVLSVLFTRFSYVYVIITCVTFLVFTGWTLHINEEMGQTRSEMNAVENEASARLTDSLINVEAVKAFDNAPLELHQYDTTLSRYESIAIRNEWLYGRLNMGQNVAYTLGLTALLARAAVDVAAGRITVGAVVLLATMVQRLWIPLDFLGWQYREVKQSLIDVQNLFEVLAVQPAIADAADAVPLQPSGGEIVFENVSFQYPDASEVTLPFMRRSTADQNESDIDSEMSESSDTFQELDEGDSSDFLSYTSDTASDTDSMISSEGAPRQTRRRTALDGLSFHVPAGKSVAIVGSSGSGKSTATRLLYRLYDLTGGRILIDGQDISKATLASLRRAVSIVPQDTSLFNDTIAYNIRYGRPDATDEEVVEAAKAASIHDVIMRTSAGYDTIVGERGVRLSGGERQRLSVARAFLKGSCVIIEDESTSALDTLTELAVSHSLQKLGVNRSRIIVAHRLSTIMNVDKIVVLQMGRKVEEGSFDELVAKEGGVFRGMWELQQRKDDEAIEVMSMEEETAVSEEREGMGIRSGEGDVDLNKEHGGGNNGGGRFDEDLALDGGGSRSRA